MDAPGGRASINEYKNNIVKKSIGTRYGVDDDDDASLGHSNWYQSRVEFVWISITFARELSRLWTR